MPLCSICTAISIPGFVPRNNTSKFLSVLSLENILICSAVDHGKAYIYNYVYFHHYVSSVKIYKWHIKRENNWTKYREKN